MSVCAAEAGVLERLVDGGIGIAEDGAAWRTGQRQALAVALVVAVGPTVSLSDELDVGWNWRVDRSWRGLPARLLPVFGFRHEVWVRAGTGAQHRPSAPSGATDDGRAGS